VDHPFLDSCGSSLMPRPVADEMAAHLRRETEVGGYRAARERRDDLEAGYGVFASLLGCRTDQVAFTDSATRSWLSAFDALPLAAGDRILVGEAEYAGNAVPLLMRAEAAGASVEAVPSDKEGPFSADALADMLDERVALVSLVHVPTNSGAVAEVRRIADAAHQAGALVLLDACQSVGQLRIDLEELDADILTATGRKWLRGPRGTGVLVVGDRARDRLRPRLADLHGGAWTAPDQYSLREYARVYELWEHDVAGRLGLIRAARYLLELGVTDVEAAVADRAAELRAKLAALPGVSVRDEGAWLSGIVTFTVDGIPADGVREALALQGITVSSSARSSTLLDMTHRGLEAVVRASPHYFVTYAQIDETVAAVAELRPR
jgi:selenocysteine lyase/cysteine desulfurase